MTKKQKQLKVIIVTGGVLSGLGKGIAAASIGHLLSSKLKVVPMKLDGYLNVDPGTMNPIEHGEVFVLDDGGEVDMDFGHYERYLGVTCKFEQNLTMGKVYNEVREKERRGDYLGRTVQYVPHVVDLIKSKFYDVSKKEEADILIIELGGTVGDIETELYIEACRQLKKDLGEENVLYVHLTYVPIPAGVNEQKSKPTQQSVKLLRERGIQPDIIIGRCPEFLDEKIKEKIATFCDVEKEAVISGVDVDNVYKIPIIFEKEGICEIIHKKLNIYSPPNLRKWSKLLDNLDSPDGEITIAICGKYTKLADSYASINEALMHCSAHFKRKINLKFIETTEIEENKKTVSELLKGVAGVIVPGGFGTRGTEGKISVIKYCREKGLPFLGICLGLQLAVTEFARHVCGLKDANSTEINSKTPEPVVDIMPEQIQIQNKGGTMRLGAYKAILTKGTLAHTLYGSTEAWERHRHRYEVNPDYHDCLRDNGLVLSGMSEDGILVEFIELKDHHYFIATQSHPELKSKLETPAPLFYGLIDAAVKYFG
ncbi:CTP synthase (glutamine hydrolyzing) [Candidatus Woesearchaeota archaeon]|jgi:CTP synthase|nr:CTP synthase (glutamine hydrolyzing) [Candidatus Woesearchaeota archaeon]MBT6519473.1 CTP synthase (glutamine hydrolyzing) [Candidatus Woesearchaeota archaeon]MBT7368221.1 CTP synthase (glutamine hydrolyzing) [Candidatus Woesearchaeota archaeon]